MIFLRTIKALLHRLAIRLGLAKRYYYERDAKLADVINRICVALEHHGSYVVAVETKQGMVQVMSYMEKNGISACAVTSDTIGRFHRLNMKGALACMEAAPYKYQVYVMFKPTAAVGWRVPREYQDAWGKVHLLTTFTPREPWATQFFGRTRNAI